MCGPTNVTEVGWKFGGTGFPDPAADSADPAGVTFVLDRELGLPPPVPVTRGPDLKPGGVPAATGCPWLGPWLCSVLAICGTVAAAAITTTMPAADITARPVFRRRARCRIWLEGARRRRQRLDLGVQPVVDPVSWITHRQAPRGSSSAAFSRARA